MQTLQAMPLSRPADPRAPTRRLAAITLATLVLLLAWDAAGLDLPLAAWFGSASGFALRDNWLLADLLHQGGRFVSWAAACWLTVGLWWPAGGLERIDLAGRLQLASTVLLAVLAVAALKSFSRTSCPWDLAAFGRSARYLSHWAFAGDGGPGRCFPAGHASSGFAFIGGWFVFRERAPRVALAWLAGALTAGLVFGIAQQMRGAHFMSHTLWTAWLCWTLAWLADLAWRQARRRAVPAADSILTAW